MIGWLDVQPKQVISQIEKMNCDWLDQAESGLVVPKTSKLS